MYVSSRGYDTNNPITSMQQALLSRRPLRPCPVPKLELGMRQVLALTVSHKPGIHVCLLTASPELGLLFSQLETALRSAIFRLARRCAARSRFAMPASANDRA